MACSMIRPTPVFLPGESQGRGSLVGRGSQAPRRAVCGTRGSLRTMHGGGSAPSCSGDGNGNLLQYSCLKNPMGRGAWWAIVHGPAKSQYNVSLHAESARGTLNHSVIVRVNMQVRRTTGVLCVTSLSPRRLTWNPTWSSTRGRRTSSVTTVTSCSCGGRTSSSTCSSTRSE